MSIYYESGVRPALDSANIMADRKNKYVKLEWQEPEYEVFTYDVYRGKSKNNMELIKTLDPKSVQMELIDRNVYINNEYMYAIKYITSDGVHSLPVYLKVIY